MVTNIILILEPVLFCVLKSQVSRLQNISSNYYIIQQAPSKAGLKITTINKEQIYFPE